MGVRESSWVEEKKRRKNSGGSSVCVSICEDFSRGKGGLGQLMRMSGPFSESTH